MRHTFIPDYSVKSVTEVIYIVIKRNLYFAAKRATLMERSAQKLDPTTEAIDDEMEKVIKIVENIFIVSRIIRLYTSRPKIIRKKKHGRK